MEDVNNTWPAELLELFDDPLLEGVRPPQAPMTADDRTQQKITELRAWIDAQGREPDIKSEDRQEKVLSVAMQTLKEMGLWT